MPRGISVGTTHNNNNNNKNIPTITNTAMTVVAVIVAGVGSHMWYSRLEKLRGMLQPATLPCARQCAFGPVVSAAAGIVYRSACQWHMCLSTCTRKTMNC